MRDWETIEIVRTRATSERPVNIWDQTTQPNEANPNPMHSNKLLVGTDDSRVATEYVRNDHQGLRLPTSRGIISFELIGTRLIRS